MFWLFTDYKCEGKLGTSHSPGKVFKNLVLADADSHIENQE